MFTSEVYAKLEQRAHNECVSIDMIVNAIIGDYFHEENNDELIARLNVQFRDIPHADNDTSDYIKWIKAYRVEKGVLLQDAKKIADKAWGQNVPPSCRPPLKSIIAPYQIDAPY
jgi:hypothetical protein